MNTLTPADLIEVCKLIAALDWQPLSDSDHACFCDAGPNARIANISASRSADIAEIFDIRPDNSADFPLMGIIGGDETQIEFHGVDAQDEPVHVQINLNIYAD